MVVDELCQDENDVVLDEKPDSEPDDKRESFYEIDSDDETCPSADVESEVMEFLRSAKSLECLGKFPKVKRL